MIRERQLPLQLQDRNMYLFYFLLLLIFCEKRSWCLYTCFGILIYLPLGGPCFEKLSRWTYYALLHTLLILL